MKRRTGLVQTKPFAESLLAKPNEWVRWWQFGRLSIVWDTNRSAPEPVPTSELIPELDDSNAPDWETSEPRPVCFGCNVYPSAAQHSAPEPDDREEEAP